MNKVKILHITQSVIGGTLVYLKLFFSFINREKYDIELICPSYGPMKNEIEALGIKVHTIEMVREISLFNDIEAFRELNRYIKTSKPDIIHIHSSKAGVIGRGAAYLNNIPCIYNPHGWSFSMDICEGKKKVYSFIERICAYMTRKIVLISDFEKNLALQYKIAPIEKMEVIYNGIDIDKFVETRCINNYSNLHGIPEDSYIVGMVGRITLAKNYKLFIEIANKLVDEIANCFFIIVGDGELREEITDLIMQKGLAEKILITGWTDEVDKYISIFDVALLTSSWEGFGLVLLEYMARGKPIVASNVGGIPSAVENGFNGILAECNNVDSFIKAILKLKNNSELRDRFVENGYIILNNKFNIKNVVSEHEKIYQEIVNSSAGKKSRRDLGFTE